MTERRRPTKKPNESKSKASKSRSSKTKSSKQPPAGKPKAPATPPAAKKPARAALVSAKPKDPAESLTRDERRVVVRDLVAEVRSAGEAIRTQLLRVGDLVYEARFQRRPAIALSVDLERDEFFAEIAAAIEQLDLGFTAARLSVLVRIVALNQRIRSPYWDKIDEGRKELLLPLKSDEDRIDGATYAFRMQPSHTRLREWVKERLAANGEPIQERGVSARGVEHSLEHLAKVASPKSIERLGRDLAKVKPKAKERLREKVARVREALAMLDELLRGDGEPEDG